eukprot:728070-Rhodomonas_salina.1
MAGITQTSVDADLDHDSWWILNSLTGVSVMKPCSVMVLAMMQEFDQLKEEWKYWTKSEVLVFNA